MLFMNRCPEFETMFTTVKMNVILLSSEESAFFSVCLCIMYVFTVLGQSEVIWHNMRTGVCHCITLLVDRMVTQCNACLM